MTLLYRRIRAHFIRCIFMIAAFSTVLHSLTKASSLPSLAASFSGHLGTGSVGLFLLRREASW